MQTEKKKVVLIEVHVFRDKKQVMHYLGVVDPEKALSYKIKIFNTFKAMVISDFLKFEFSSIEKEELVSDLKVSSHDKKIDLFDVTGFEKKMV